jgi:hypothetical protein
LRQNPKVNPGAEFMEQMAPDLFHRLTAPERWYSGLAWRRQLDILDRTAPADHEQNKFLAGRRAFSLAAALSFGASLLMLFATGVLTGAWSAGHNKTILVLDIASFAVFVLLLGFATFRFFQVRRYFRQNRQSSVPQ